MGASASTPVKTHDRTLSQPAARQRSRPSNTVMNEKMNGLSLEEKMDPYMHCTTQEGKISASDTQEWVAQVLQDPKVSSPLSIVLIMC